MANISLSVASLSNILALRRTTEAIALTQERLASGLKVASAVDDSSAFFTSRTLSSRASDLLTIKDDIDQAISTVGAAVTGIEAIDDLVEQMKGLAQTARSSSDSATRSKSAVQFNDLRTQLDNLANDASFNSTNLVKASPGNLKVTFSEDGSSTITISGIASDVSSLSISTAASDWLADANIDAAINQLDSALTTVRSTASTLGTSSSLLSLRLTFTENLINALEEGAGKLVNADLNEESANLLTLQTRQQLGVIGLSVAQAADQAVFRLF